MNFMNFQTFYSLSSNPHSLQYLREQFFLADLRRFKNADLRWYSLRLSARVHFCDICENYSFSLIYADLKTQIYADIFCESLRGFFLRISARTIFFSLINADLKTQIYADFFLRLSARVFSANICENYFFSLIYADLKTQIYADIFCDYLRGFISAISARTIFSHWFTQI